jgi:hypothetical protein
MVEKYAKHQQLDRQGGWRKSAGQVGAPVGTEES